MKINEVKTKADLYYLYQRSAMTWEGLRSEDFEVTLKECGQPEAEGFKTTGKVMNEICKLTGNNAYPDDLNIFSIAEFKGLAINYGARWMDDIVDNNARRQKHHPFGGLHYGI